MASRCSGAGCRCAVGAPPLAPSPSSHSSSCRRPPPAASPLGASTMKHVVPPVANSGAPPAAAAAGPTLPRSAATAAAAASSAKGPTPGAPAVPTSRARRTPAQGAPAGGQAGPRVVTASSHGSSSASIASSSPADASSRSGWAEGWRMQAPSHAAQGNSQRRPLPGWATSAWDRCQETACARGRVGWRNTWESVSEAAKVWAPSRSPHTRRQADRGLQTQQRSPQRRARRLAARRGCAGRRALQGRGRAAA
jgi:hypothetical protein